MTRAVIYPIANGNYKDSNAELIFSLRAVASNLREDVPVIVISEREPMYLSDEVRFIESESYRDALLKACSVADEILWMNDDISLLRPHTWEDFRSMPRSSEQWSDKKIEESSESGTEWGKRKAQVLRAMKERGHTTYDYSSHSPYLFETEKLIQIITEFDFGYKTPYETAYGNTFSVPRRENFSMLSRHHDGLLPVDCSEYDILNYADMANLDHVRGFLLGKFPAPCRFENHGTSKLSTTLLSQIK